MTKKYLLECCYCGNTEIVINDYYNTNKFIKCEICGDTNIIKKKFDNNNIFGYDELEVEVDETRD